MTNKKDRIVDIATMAVIPALIIAFSMIFFQISTVKEKQQLAQEISYDLIEKQNKAYYKIIDKIQGFYTENGSNLRLPFEKNIDNFNVIIKEDGLKTKVSILKSRDIKNDDNMCYRIVNYIAAEQKTGDIFISKVLFGKGQYNKENNNEHITNMCEESNKYNKTKELISFTVKSI